MVQFRAFRELRGETPEQVTKILQDQTLYTHQPEYEIPFYTKYAKRTQS